MTYAIGTCPWSAGHLLRRSEPGTGTFLDARQAYALDQVCCLLPVYLEQGIEDIGRLATVTRQRCQPAPGWGIGGLVQGHAIEPAA